MPELTQEQLDALVAEKIAEAKKGLFTEEDLNKKVTSEVDRRVESGIQKGLETQKQKWEREFAERAKLSAEELAQKDYSEKLQTISAKEQDIKRRANLIEAKELLNEAEIPKSHYDGFMKMLVTDDEAVTKENVNNFITMFKVTKTDIETKVKSELSTISAPKAGSGEKVVDKAAFTKMGYAEKLDFKQKHPDLYKEFMK